MHQHQYVDIFVDVIEIRRQGAHVEQLLQLSVDGPGLAHLSGLGIELSLQTDRTQQADHRLFRRAELLDELRHVVFQKFFPIGREIRDGGTAIGRVGSRQAKIH
jgi:hypothetical protein